MRDRFEQMAKNVGASLSKNADKILAIKARAIDEFACPCYPDDKNHFCISPLCLQELNTNGKCHCGLFVKEIINA